MGRSKRAVGYCQNEVCEDYAKGIFLLNASDTYYCPRCRQLGRVEKEHSFYTGNTDVFREVRIEYNYDPINRVYRDIAIVRDDSLYGRCNVYTLQSPLIRTEVRALKVAEQLLSHLNRFSPFSTNCDPWQTSTEIILRFDDPREVFLQKLGKLEKEWIATRDRMEQKLQMETP